MPSEKVPVAVSCAVVPFAIERFAGVTAIEVKYRGRDCHGGRTRHAPPESR